MYPISVQAEKKTTEVLNHVSDEALWNKYRNVTLGNQKILKLKTCTIALLWGLKARTTGGISRTSFSLRCQFKCKSALLWMHPISFAVFCFHITLSFSLFLYENRWMLMTVVRRSCELCTAFFAHRVFYSQFKNKYLWRFTSNGN